MGVFLSELTWVEAEEAFKKTQTVLIPTGSTEQHGFHLPLGADWIEAEGLAKMITARANVITTPIIPIGIAAHHMDFPGTLSINNDHYTNYVMDFCESLVTWGAKRFVFMSGHGGNTESHAEVALKLRNKYGIVSAIIHWWDVIKEFDGIPTMQHAGFAETSLVATFRPELVKYDKAKPEKSKSLSKNIRTANITILDFKGATIRTFLRTRDISVSGYMPDELDSPEGDLKRATPEVGHRFAEIVVDSIVDFIEEFRDLGPLSSP